MRGRRGNGFTLIELIIVVCIVAVTTAVLLDRLLYYQERAERAKMEQVAVILRVALQFRILTLVTAGRLADVESINGENPMDWLSEKPRNYLGTLFDPDPKDLPRGVWYFDTKAHRLVYVLNRSRHFVSSQDGAARIYFRVGVEVRTDGKRPRDAKVPLSEISRFGLYPDSRYSWFEEETDVARHLLKWNQK